MKKEGAWAFGLGFFLAAIPLTIWLLTLEYGDNGLKVAVAIIVEFLAGFAARALYLKLIRHKIKAN